MKETNDRNVKVSLLMRTFEYLIRNGLESVSIRSISKETGISSGSLYYWFNNKDDLIMEATKCGLTETVDKIFNFAFNTIDDLEYLFNNILTLLEKYEQRLKFVYQLATSPYYGERLKNETESLTFLYDEYAEKLADKINCNKEELRPIVYIFIAVVLDYIIWKETDKTKMMLDYIYKGILTIRS